MAPKFVEVSKILSYFSKNKILTTQAYDVFISLASEITKIYVILTSLGNLSNGGKQ